MKIRRGYHHHEKIGDEQKKSNGLIFGGFTLVEILVAVTVLATLVAGVVLAINPARQLEKSKDAARSADIESIKTALETYYHDNGCYPTALSFGEEFKSEDGSTVYMKKVPQDPDCDDSSQVSCYQYRTDTSTECPQWNVTFAKLSGANTSSNTASNTCPLSALSNCSPQGYSTGSWACSMSGEVKCDGEGGLASAVLVVPTPASSEQLPEDTSAPQSGTTPTPTSILGSTTQSFTVAMNTFPWFSQGTVTPHDTSSGAEQTLTIRAQNEQTAPISSVRATIKIGQSITTYSMALQSGTNTDGIWSGTWTIPAHTSGLLQITISATDSIGRVASTDLSLP